MEIEGNQLAIKGNQGRINACQGRWSGEGSAGIKGNQGESSEIKKNQGKTMEINGQSMEIRVINRKIKEKQVSSHALDCKSCKSRHIQGRWRGKGSPEMRSGRCSGGAVHASSSSLPPLFSFLNLARTSTRPPCTKH